jgi:hypothetical protein
MYEDEFEPDDGFRVHVDEAEVYALLGADNVEGFKVVNHKKLNTQTSSKAKVTNSKAPNILLPPPGPPHQT